MEGNQREEIVVGDLVWLYELDTNGVHSRKTGLVVKSFKFFEGNIPMWDVIDGEGKYWQVWRCGFSGKGSSRGTWFKTRSLSNTQTSPAMSKGILVYNDK